MNSPLRLALFRVLLPAALATGLSAATFEVLPASGDFVGMGQIGAISADGATVAAAGWSLASWGPQAVKWTPLDGARRLDTATTPAAGAAWGVSANGTVLAGWRFNSTGRAACWVNGAPRALTSLNNAVALDVSRDGTIAVGRNATSNSNTAYGTAARWSTATGVATSLGDLPGGLTHSEATRISADGTTIVGWATSAAGVVAFRAPSGSTMVSLGDLSGGRVFSEALAVSADGAVVVGRSHSGLGIEAFRWTTGTGMVGLGDLPGGAYQSSATAVSGDGTIVVGLGTSAADGEVFVWEPSRGMRSLSAITRAAGLPLDNYRFTYCRPVLSEDGDTIAGDAIAPDQTQVLWRLTGLRALLANIPTPAVQIQIEANTVYLRFPTDAGFIYQVQKTTDLARVPWTDLGASVTGDGLEQFIDTTIDAPACFYRLVVRAGP
jgi:probable HAF family extracellular repeat protein